MTVFFDKLDLGPAFPPLPPPGLRPPLPPGAAPPAPGAPAPGAPGEVPATGGYPYGAYPYANFEDDDDDSDDTEEDTFEDDDGYYDDGYYGDDESRRGRRRRRKRETNWKKSERLHHCSSSGDFKCIPSLGGHQVQKRSAPFNHTVYAAERAVLLPKLENMLDSAGLGGRPCLLRAICEVHEAPLHHYGLLGELFTMFFRYVAFNLFLNRKPNFGWELV